MHQTGMIRNLTTASKSHLTRHHCSGAMRSWPPLMGWLWTSAGVEAPSPLSYRADETEPSVLQIPSAERIRGHQRIRKCLGGTVSGLCLLTVSQACPLSQTFGVPLLTWGYRQLRCLFSMHIALLGIISKMSHPPSSLKSNPCAIHPRT